MLVLPIRRYLFESIVDIWPRYDSPFSVLVVKKQNFKPFLKEKQSENQGSVQGDADSRWNVSYIWKSVNSLPQDSFSHMNYFELYKARLVYRKNVNNKVLICAE